MEQTTENAVQLKNIDNLVIAKPKHKFHLEYARGLVQGKDKVIVNLYFNDAILAQGFADPGDIIEHLQATLQEIQTPTP